MTRLEETPATVAFWRASWMHWCLPRPRIADGADAAKPRRAVARHCTARGLRAAVPLPPRSPCPGVWWTWPATCRRGRAHGGIHHPRCWRGNPPTGLAHAVCTARATGAQHGRLVQPCAEFPNMRHSELPIAKEGERAMNEPVPMLQRYLPFWLANLIERMWLVLGFCWRPCCPCPGSCRRCTSSRARSRVFRLVRPPARDRRHGGV